MFSDFRKPPGKLIKVFRLILIAFSGYIIITSGYEIIGNVWLSANALRVTGTVSSSYSEHIEGRTSHSTGKTRSSSSYSKTVERPIFEYDVDGQNYQVYGTLSSIGLHYEVGDKVEIWTIPGNPGYGKVNGFIEMWLKPVLLILCSCLLLILAWLLPLIAGFISHAFRQMSNA